MKTLLQIIKEEIGSYFNDIHDYYDEYDNIFRNILSNMVNKSKNKIKLKKIKPSMYQKALDDFIKFGEITHYPTNYIRQWKNIVIENTIMLDVITMFMGHASYFDVDSFNDSLFGDDNVEKHVPDWSEAWEYMGKMGYVDALDDFLPKFTNGHDLISDYGLEPLQKIVEELIKTNDPDKIIVLINKALDISHQRSDLSEIFIEGGESSLDRISGI